MAPGSEPCRHHLAAFGLPPLPLHTAATELPSPSSFFEGHFPAFLPFAWAKQIFRLTVMIQNNLNVSKQLLPEASKRPASTLLHI